MPLNPSRLSPQLLPQIPDDDSLRGVGTNQPNSLSTPVEEVQLSEEELQKARDDFKVSMALGRLFSCTRDSCYYVILYYIAAPASL